MVFDEFLQVLECFLRVVAKLLHQKPGFVLGWQLSACGAVFCKHVKKAIFYHFRKAKKKSKTSKNTKKDGLETSKKCKTLKNTKNDGSKTSKKCQTLKNTIFKGCRH